MKNNSEYINDFVIEAKEHIESAEVLISNLVVDADNFEAIDGLFRDFHTIKGLAGFVSKRLVQKIAHQTESLLDKCRKGGACVNEQMLAFLNGAVDFIKSILENLSLDDDPDFSKTVHNFLFEFEPNCDFGIESSLEQNLEAVIDEIIDQSQSPAISTDVHNPNPNFVRIPMEKIDLLADTAGELIINCSQFEQAADALVKKNERLNTSLRRVLALTKDIQRLSMSLRMVSLKQLFTRIENVGKDTIARLSKNAAIVIYGEETELDRGIVEKLADPLIHLIKNCIYHGIEDAKTRVIMGKPAVGNVEIKAVNKRDGVFIEITDDGRGIDIEAVFKKAVEKNLINPFMDYSDEDVLSFIFLPGLSTVESPDDISGRGVGLDVVKTQISKMGGSVTVQSVKNRGTSFTMHLPLSISVISGIVVLMGDEEYIIPTSYIKCVYKPSENERISFIGTPGIIQVGEKNVPIVFVGGLTDDIDITECIFAILEVSGRTVALPVKSVLEKRDVVLKPLGEDFENLHYAFGATILGSGRVAVILDVENVIKHNTGEYK